MNTITELRVTKEFRFFLQTVTTLIAITLSIVVSIIPMTASEPSDEDTEFKNMIFRLNDNEKSYYVNINGDKVTNQFYEHNNRNAKIYEKGIGYIAVVRDGLSGLIDTYGREILPCKYQWIDYCIHNEYQTLFQVKSDDKHALFNPINGFMTQFIYDDIRHLDDVDVNVIPSKNKGKWCFVNCLTGEEISSNSYSYLSIRITTDNYNPNRKILFIATKGNGRYGVVNSEGKELTPFIHTFESDYVNSKAYYYSIDRLLLQNSDSREWYIYNIVDGKRKSLGNYDVEGYPVGNLVILKKSGRYGIKDLSKDKFIFPCEYQELFSPFTLYNNFIFITSTEGVSIFTNRGEEIASNTKYHSRNWDDYMQSHKMHLINNLDWDLLTTCDVERNKWGTLDINGKIIIPFIYDSLSDFKKNGLAIYQDKDKYGVIDKNNHVRIPAEYDWLSEQYTNGDLTLFLAEKNRKYGIISSSNKIIMPIEYDHINVFDENGLALFEKGNQYGYVNIDGEIISSSYDSDKNELLCYQYLFKHQPSDVDKNIPANSLLNDRTFAVIIANEEYSESGISKVNYAHNDGEIFKKYCEQALGIPSSNIRFVKDATFNQIRSSVNWISDRAKVFDGEAELLIYYSGHGIPDEKDGKAYLMPSDGIANDTRSYYSLAELYDQIGALPSKKSVILLDACFSGTSKEGNMMLANTKGIALKHEPEPLTGNTIVFSAAQGDETAFSYNRKKHSLFTYYLLKKLQEGDGKVSLGELSTYVNKKVRQESVLKLGKTQTPTVNVSDEFSDKWESLTL